MSAEDKFLKDVFEGHPLDGRMKDEAFEKVAPGVHDRVTEMVRELIEMGAQGVSIVAMVEQPRLENGDRPVAATHVMGADPKRDMNKFDVARVAVQAHVKAIEEDFDMESGAPVEH